MRSIPQALAFRTDRRDMPMYSVSEAAEYIHVPASTLTSWLYGRPYGTQSGKQQSRPIIVPADAEHGRLSFYNLVEAHILSATRKKHNIQLPRIRAAVDYIRGQFPASGDHPLITQEFYTDGKNLFVKELEDTVNASKRGQLALSALVDEYLELISRDATGMPNKLYPKTGDRAVVINPDLSSGRPVLKGTGVLVSLISQRVEAGERIEDLASNYGVARSEIDAAIKYVKAA